MRVVVAAVRAAMTCACLVPLISAGQEAPANFVSGVDLALGTKTPLGDARIVIPAGTSITNFAIEGANIRIWQGPFSSTFVISEIEKKATPTGAAEIAAGEGPAPAARPAESAPEEKPAAPPAATPPVPATAPEVGAAAGAWPEWLVPAAGGALLAYALVTTFALFRRRSTEKPVRTAPRKKSDAPVVTIPVKKEARPAVVSDGGKAIACPLCGKSIPLENISRGRNRCPSCHGTFVGE